MTQFRFLYCISQLWHPDACRMCPGTITTALDQLSEGTFLLLNFCYVGCVSLGRAGFHLRVSSIARALLQVINIDQWVDLCGRMLNLAMGSGKEARFGEQDSMQLVLRFQAELIHYLFFHSHIWWKKAGFGCLERDCSAHQILKQMIA